VQVATGSAFSIVLVAGSLLVCRLTIGALPTIFIAAAVAIQFLVIAGVLSRHWTPRCRIALWAGLGAAGATLAAVPGLPMRIVGLVVTGGCHTAAYSALLIWFGLSLRPGHEPIVTGFARRVRQTMPDSVVRYTRKVTIAWCVFFAGQLVVSTTLLLFAPHAAWFSFVTLLNLPLVVMMALAEFACRRVLFRHEDYTGLIKTLSALRHGGLMPANRS
jgi:uncharacterized membrane protein